MISLLSCCCNDSTVSMIMQGIMDMRKKRLDIGYEKVCWYVS